MILTLQLKWEIKQNEAHESFVESSKSSYYFLFPSCQKATALAAATLSESTP